MTVVVTQASRDRLVSRAMSTPPPPPGYNPPPQPYGQPGQQPPPGYQQFGNQPVGNQRTNGMSVASLVLSLVNIIPCFWAFPLPALLGVIFGFVGKNQIAKDAGQKGRGLAIAGLAVGVVFLIVGVIFWVYISTSDNCVRDGASFTCVSN